MIFVVDSTFHDSKELVAPPFSIGSKVRWTYAELFFSAFCSTDLVT